MMSSDQAQSIASISIEDKCSLWHSLRNGFVGGSATTTSTAAVEEVPTNRSTASGTFFTHAQLYHAACSLASKLQSRCDVFTGDRVVLVLDNSPSVLVVLYAVAGCGGVAVSCNTKLTATELTATISGLGAKLIVCDERHVHVVETATLRSASEEQNILMMIPGEPIINRLPRVLPIGWQDQFTRRFIAITKAKADTPPHRIAKNSAPWVPGMSSASLALSCFQVMFTSGTTDRQKGVVHSQCSVAANARRVVNEFKFTSFDVWLHATPMFHALDVFAIFACIISGTKQVIIAGNQSGLLGGFSSSGTAHAIFNHSINISAMVAAQISIIAGAYPYILRNIRVVSCGGSAVLPDFIAQVLNTAPKTNYFTDYGMTEVCGRMTTSALSLKEFESLNAIPATDRQSILRATGRCVSDIEMAVADFIIDDTGMTVQNNHVGEVVVRSARLGSYWSQMHGVHGFTNCPLETTPTWFRTGDIASVDPCGWITIVDRSKNIIVSGGENVFCLEVETSLCNHPRITDAAVYGVADSILGESVEASVSCDALSISNALEQDILAHCRSTLAPFKVPRRIVLQGCMPRTSTGKILKGKLQRRALVTANTTPAQQRNLLFHHNNDVFSRDDLIKLIRGNLINTLYSSRDMHDITAISEDAPLAHMGIHSTVAVELSRKLSAGLMLHANPLPSLLAFNEPTIGSIADYILCRRANNKKMCAFQRHRIIKEEVGNHASRDPVIVINQCATFPLPSNIEGSDVKCAALGLLDVQEKIPHQRWDADSVECAVKVPHFAAFLSRDIGACDAELVGASYTELVSMDPTHRLLVESCARSTLDSRFDPAPVSRYQETTSIFVGCMWSEYADFSVKHLGTCPNPRTGTGVGMCFLAGRVSYTLDLKGACVVVNTACSSSLVAVHLGSKSLDCHAQSITAGVSLILSPGTAQRIGMLGALSMTGRCKTLDANADGYGRSEGCAIFINSSNNNVCAGITGNEACIAGSWINQDGRSSSLTTPNGASQKELLTRTAANVRGTLDMKSIAMHGTATPLGDPIEVAALVDACGRKLNSSRRIILCAPKSTLGHMEGTAGCHSMLSALVSLLSVQDVPIAHLRHVSSHVVFAVFKRVDLGFTTQHRGGNIDNENAPFANRHAGCQAFGMSGVNAHVITQHRSSTSTIDILMFTRMLIESAFLTSAWACPRLDTILDCSSSHGKIGNLSYIFLLSPHPSSSSDLVMDHRVCNQTLFPAAATISMFTAAAKTILDESGPQNHFSLKNMVLSKPLIVDFAMLLNDSRPGCQISLDAYLSMDTKIDATYHNSNAPPKVKCQINPIDTFKCYKERVPFEIYKPMSTQLSNYNAIARLNIRDKMVSHPTDAHILPQALDSGMHIKTACWKSPVIKPALHLPCSIQNYLSNNRVMKLTLTVGVCCFSKRSNHIIFDINRRTPCNAALTSLATKEVVGRFLHQRASSRVPSSSADLLYLNRRLALPTSQKYGIKSRSSTSGKHVMSSAVGFKIPKLLSSKVVQKGVVYCAVSILQSYQTLAKASNEPQHAYLGKFALRSNQRTGHNTALFETILRVAALENRWNILCISFSEQLVNWHQVHEQSLSISSCSREPQTSPVAYVDAGIERILLPILLNRSNNNSFQATTNFLHDVMVFGLDARLNAPSLLRMVFRQSYVKYFSKACSKHLSKVFTTFVTGGVGAIAVEVGIWLTDEVSSQLRLCLTGQTGRNSNKVLSAKLNYLATSAGIVHFVKSNAAVTDDSYNASEAIRMSVLFTVDISTIIHASGYISDAALHDQHVSSLRTVLAPKIDGMQCLGKATFFDMLPITSTIIFSSIAALFGSPGQAGYSSANKAMDIWAESYRYAGIPIASIQWGAWSQLGMATRNEDVIRRVQRTGIGVLTNGDGICALNAIFESCSTGDFPSTVTAGRFDWDRLRSHMIPFPQECADLCKARIAKKPAYNSEHKGQSLMLQSNITKQKLSVPGEEEINEIISNIVGELIGEEVSKDEPLMAAGLDSLAGLDLKSLLGDAFSLRLPNTIVYDYSSIQDLTTYIYNLLSNEHRDMGIPSSPSIVKASLHFRSYVFFHQSGNFVQISGNSTRTPTAVPSINKFVVTDTINRVPRARWSMERYMDVTNKWLPGHGSFLPCIEVFDAKLFSVGRMEATLMDPQHRGLLEMLVLARASRSCTLATYPDAVSRNTSVVLGTGVFVGIADQSYKNCCINTFWVGGVHPYIATGNTLSCAAGRICFLFDLHGPAVSIDTACSSSIVAAHIAMASLCGAEIARGVASGTHSILDHDGTATFNAAGMLSTDGRCKTMDISADGYVRGEAVGTLILEAMKIGDGCKVLNKCTVFTFLSSAINQDGRSSSLTAPSGLAQQAVIKLALQAGSIHPKDIHTLQMHGTGTSLGDPIEFGASIDVLKRVDILVPLLLEAVKSFIGHTECASGIIGLMQSLECVLWVSSKKVLHLTTINMHLIDVLESMTAFSGSRYPIHIGRGSAASVLPRDVKETRRNFCGIGSFAFQGTNGQAILGERTTGYCELVGCKEELSLHDPERYWVGPRPHAYLQGHSEMASVSETHVLHADVDKRILSHMWDHQIANKIIFPAAAFFEGAIAGGKLSLLSDTARATELTICDSVIMVPLSLLASKIIRDEAYGQVKFGEQKLSMNLLVNKVSSCLEITSLPPRRSNHIVHFKGFLSNIVRACHNSKHDSRSFVSLIFAGIAQRTSNMSMDLMFTSVHALAFLSNTKCDFLPGYSVHPAYLDNSMQIMASLEVFENSDVQVPVGATAFLISEHDSFDIMHEVSAERLAPRNTVSFSSSNHILRCLHRNSDVARLAGLQIKSIRPVSMIFDVNSSAELRSNSFQLSKVPNNSSSRKQQEESPQVSFATKWLVCPSLKPTANCQKQAVATRLHHHNISLAHPSNLISLLQDGTSLVKRVLLCTRGGGQSDLLSDRCSSSSSLSAAVKNAAAHGIMRTAAHECRSSLINSINIGFLDSSLAKKQQQPSSDTFQIGTLNEESTHGNHVFVPRLLPTKHISSGSRVLPICIPGDCELPNGRIAVRIQAMSELPITSLMDMTRLVLQKPRGGSKEGSKITGFSGNVLDSSTLKHAIGSAVIGVLITDKKDGPQSSGHSIEIVDERMCISKPINLSFEEAASLPVPQITAQACINILHNTVDALISACDFVIMLHGRECEAKHALIARLNNLSIMWAEDLSYSSGVAVKAAIGPLEGGSAEWEWNIVEQICSGGLFIKTSSGPCLCTDYIRNVWDGGLVSGGFIRKLEPEHMAESDPTIVSDALMISSLLRCIPEALLYIVHSHVQGISMYAERSIKYATCNLHFQNIAHHSNDCLYSSYQARAMFAIRLPKNSVFFHASNTLCCAYSSRPAVITGGLGGIGTVAMNWLGQQITRHIHIYSRQGHSNCKGLTARNGGMITVHRCDSSHADEIVSIAAFLRCIFYEEDALGIILHASGVLHDALLFGQNAGSVAKVMGAKVSSAIRLHQVNGAQPIHATVMFSSIAALLGSASQINYSGANSALDWMAQNDRSKGVSTASVQWGAWESVGMAAKNKNAIYRIKRMGMGVLSNELGIATLSSIIGSVDSIASSPFMWSRQDGTSTSKLPAMCSDLVDTPKTEMKVSVKTLLRPEHYSGKSSISNRLNDIINEGSGANISFDEPFANAGLDSLSALELKGKIETEFSVTLPDTVMFDYPNNVELSKYIQKIIESDDSSDRLEHHDQVRTGDSALHDDRRNVSFMNLREADIQVKVLQIMSNMVDRCLDIDEGFMDAGIDSPMGIELRTQMEAEFEIQLPDTLVFDYPTPRTLSEYILTQQLKDPEERLSLFREISDLDGQKSSDALPRWQPSRDVHIMQNTAEAISRDVQDRVVALICDQIGRSIGLDEPLIESGLDSLSGIELKTQLDLAFNTELPDTCIFDYPTAKSLSEYIARTAEGLGPEENTWCAPNTIQRDIGVISIDNKQHINNGPSKKSKMLCVTGTSFMYPSHPSTAHYSVSSIEDVMTKVPQGRWDMQAFWDKYLDVKLVTDIVPCFGGFCTSLDSFDSDLVIMSPAEARVLDVQHRSLLEAMSNAINDTCIVLRKGDDLNVPGCGVYVGISSTDFLLDHIKPTATELNAYILPGNVLSVAAGRLSYVFGLRGPSLAIDTACSSSIVSTHEASNGIRANNTKAAASCGVTAIMSVLTTGLFSAAGMLSADGRCKTLDAAADGYVRGEACGVIIIESSPRKTKSWLQVLFAGSSVNQDGRASSLTAPHGPSQQAVIQTSLLNGSIIADDMSCLQLHGTGTALGDPIEMGSIAAVCIKISKRQLPLTLEAVKSLLGHTETAAGIIGISQPVKRMAFALKQRIAHFVITSQHVYSVFSSGSRYSDNADISKINTCRQSSSAVLRCARSICGVSGFAFQGTNGHCILSLMLNVENVSVSGQSYHVTVLNRCRHWILPKAHALLRVTYLKSAFTSITQAVLDQRTCSFFWGHRLLQKPLFPMTGFCELALSGTLVDSLLTMNLLLARGIIALPYFLPRLNSNGRTFVLERSCELPNGKVDVKSTSSGGTHYRSKCCQVARSEYVPLKSSQASFSYPPFANTCQTRRKTSYGLMQGNANNVLLPFHTNPALFDNAVHISSASHFHKGDDRYNIIIPTGFAEYSAPLSSTLEVMATSWSKGDGNSEIVPGASDHVMMLPICEVLARISGLEVRHVHRQVFGALRQFHVKESRDSDSCTYHMKWDALPTRPISHVPDNSMVRRHAVRSAYRGRSISTMLSAMQVLQVRSTGNFHRIKSMALCTRDCHQYRDSKLSPCKPTSMSINPSGMLWGLWNVAAMEDISSPASWHGVDQSSCMISCGNEYNFANLRCSTHGITCYSGTVLQPRFARLELLKLEDDIENHRIAYRCRNTVITGGLGSISLICAAFIGMGIKSKVYLLSRNGRSNSPSYLALRNGVGQTVVASVDVSSSEDSVFVHMITSRNVTAVLHAAGTLRDATILHQTAGHAFKVSAPKLAVGSSLSSSFGSDSEFSSIPLQFILAFTSVASLVGSYGQAPYAAANAELESHIALERTKGGVLSAIAWGAWKNVGMAAGRSAMIAESFGLGALKPSDGGRALIKALSHTAERQVVTPFDWMILSRSINDRNMNMSAFSDIIASHLINRKKDGIINPFPHTKDTAARASDRNASNNIGNAHHFALLTGEHESSITERLVSIVYESSGLAIKEDDPLMESGLDSIAGMELQHRAEIDFDIHLEPTAVLDHPTIRLLAKHIATKKSAFTNKNSTALSGLYISNKFDTAISKAAKEVSTPQVHRVTGLMANFAGNIDSFHKICYHLSNSLQDPQVEVPLARYDLDLCYHPSISHQIGVVTVRHGAFLDWDKVECFDSSIFHISEAESLHLDPQQRLLLETSAQPILDGKDELFLERTGVYVGCMYNEVPHMQQMHNINAGSHTGTGSGAAFMCGRLSYCLSLSGPCVSTDTACSSSLVACHLARNLLHRHKNGSGLVAGVNLALLNINTSVICAIGALSADGRCKAMDSAADGYGRGEGCGVFIMKGSMGIDNLSPHITASGVNQDGRSSALTAPHGPSQQVLLNDIAFEEGNLGYSKTSSKYIVAHGTGTNLGDPIEVGSLLRYATGICGAGNAAEVIVSASKAHHGHTEGAAGVAGLLAGVAHLLVHDNAPTKHLRTLNMYISASLDSYDPHIPGFPRTCFASPALSPIALASAGTSSFGMSGVNAHTALVHTVQPSNREKSDFLWIRRKQRYAYSPRRCPLVSSWSKGRHSNEEMFITKINDIKFQFSCDHMILGKSILSAAASVCIIFATMSLDEDFAFKANMGLMSLVFSSPIWINPRGSSKRQVLTIYRSRHTCSIAFQNESQISLLKSSHGCMHQILDASVTQKGFIRIAFVSEECKRIMSMKYTEKKAAFASIIAPSREPGWIDSEVLDAALHMIASLSLESPTILHELASRSSKLSNLRLPASIDACSFTRPKDAAATNAAHRQFAASRYLIGQNDIVPNSTQHTLIRRRNTTPSHTVHDLFVKPVTYANTQLDISSGKATTNKAHSAEFTSAHVVEWAAIPVNRVHNSKRVCKCLHMQSSRFKKSRNISVYLSTAISSYQAAALAPSMGGNCVTFGSPVCFTTCAASAAFHAITRTFAQEMPIMRNNTIEYSQAECLEMAATESNMSTFDANQELRSSIQGFIEYPTIRSSAIRRVGPKIVLMERRLMVQVLIMTLTTTDILKLRFGRKLSRVTPNVRMLQRIFVGRILCKGAHLGEYSRFAVGDRVIGICTGSLSDVINVPMNHLEALREQDQFVPSSLKRITNMATQACDGKNTSFAKWERSGKVNNELKSKYNNLSSSWMSVSFTPGRFLQYPNVRATGLTHFRRGSRTTVMDDLMVVNQNGNMGRCFKVMLITGGLGALGVLLALQLVSRNGGAVAVGLTSRSGRASESTSLSSLRLSAAVIACVSADSACSESVSYSACQALRTFTGIPSFALTHSAGTIMDGSLTAQNVGTTRTVCSPKVDSLMRFLNTLHMSASPSGPIILFSSIASLLGSAGQANYAAANASLDAIARVLRYKGSCALSMQWGAWAGSGMASKHVLERTNRLGIGIVRPVDGNRAFHDILADVSNNSSHPVYAFSPVRWKEFLKVLPKPTAPIFGLVAANNTKYAVWTRHISSNSASGIVTKGIIHPKSKSKEEPIIMPSEEQTKPGAQLQAISINILNIVREVSSINISLDQPLMESGIDSLAGIELKTRLETMYQVEIPATAMFDYPSVAALSAYIYAKLDTTVAKIDNTPRAQVSKVLFEQKTRSEAPTVSTAVWIFGWAGSISFEANRLFQTDGCQLGQGDSIGLTLADRWDSNDLNHCDPSHCTTLATTTAGLFGSWVPAVHNFDAALFGILAHEVIFMDPQQRLLLEAVQSILKKRIFHSSDEISDFIVAVGISAIDYAHVVAKSMIGSPSPYIGTGNAKSACCGRLSYSFGFTGSCIAVDTACSSSLVAGHIVRKEVSESGHASERGIIAGTALILSPHATAIFASAQMLAIDSRCKTLDAKADGYVRTEAVWSVAVKSELMQTGIGISHSTHAFPKLLSSASNQDGRSSSFTAPNGPAQKCVIISAVRGARPHFSSPISKLELHGTGTALGDPIEFGAAVSVLHSRDLHGENHNKFDTLHDSNNEIEFGSVKSSCGHAEAAAGVLGVMSVISILHRQNGGQTRHLCEVNPFIAQILSRQEQSFLAATAKRQASSSPTDNLSDPTAGKVCGISSFAFQGTNANAIMSSERSLILKGAQNYPALLHKLTYCCFPCLPPTLHVSLCMPHKQYASFFIGATFRSQVRIRDVRTPQGHHRHPISTLIHLAFNGSWMMWDDSGNRPEYSVCKNILLPAFSLHGVLRVDVHIMHGSVTISEITRAENVSHSLLCNMARFIRRERDIAPPGQYVSNVSDAMNTASSMLLRCAASVQAQLEIGTASQIGNAHHRLVAVTAIFLPAADTFCTINDRIACLRNTSINGPVSIAVISHKLIIHQGHIRIGSIMFQKSYTKDQSSALSVATGHDKLSLIINRGIVAWFLLCSILIEYLSIAVHRRVNQAIQNPKAPEPICTKYHSASIKQDLETSQMNIRRCCTNVRKYVLKVDINRKLNPAADFLGFLQICDLVDHVSKVA